MAAFDGTLWDRAQFKEVLDRTKLPSWVKGVVIHCTAAPNLKQARETPYSQNGRMAKGPDQDKAFAQRLRNMKTRVNELGGRGWHVTVFENGKIGEGTPMTTQGIHSHSWNDEVLAVEMCMDGDSDDPKTEGGIRILDTAAWWTSQILKKLGLPANDSTVRFHREEPRARGRKSCPGKNVDKASFLKRVQGHMTGDVRVDLPPEGKAPETVKADWTTEEIQKHLVRLGYNPGPVDGVWGPKTEDAYKQFQQAVSVLPSGKPGPWVVNKLRTLEPYPKAPEKPTIEAPDYTDEPVGSARAPAAYRYYIDRHKLPPFKAAAIVGRLQRESYPTLKSTVWGDFMLNGKPATSKTPGAVGTAYGMAQWRGIRLDNLKKFAAARGKGIEDFWTQLDFVLEEMATTEKARAGTTMENAKVLTDAVKAMMHFERPRGYRPSCPECGDGYKETIAFAEKLMEN